MGAPRTAVSPNQVVVPADDGWGVKPEGSEDLHKVFDTKEAAIADARDTARRDGGCVLVMGLDGRVEEHISDPSAPHRPHGVQ